MIEKAYTMVHCQLNQNIIFDNFNITIQLDRGKAFYIYIKIACMQVICLEEAAFYSLVEQVVARLNTQRGEEKERWISDEQAMTLLNVKSKTTLQKLRDEGKIRFSQPQKKIILYDRASISEYLEKNARNTF